nr:carbohydrate porin [Pseudomonas sp. PIA16]
MFTLSPRTIMTSGLVAGLSLGSLLAVIPNAAFADDDDWATRSTMTGDWGGERKKLMDAGVNLTGDYVSETLRNFQGGIKKGTRYTQQIRLGAQFDLNKLLGMENAGTVQFTINDRRGNSASDDLVGNRLPAQESYGGMYTRIAELSYQRSLFTPDLTTKVGFMSMGNDFGGMGVLTNFVNAGFCAHPLSMSGGSGWGNYPTGHWGAELRYKINPEWTVQTAVFQVNPDANSASRYGMRMTTDKGTGAIAPIEAIYTRSGYLEGQYKFGWYYDSSNVQKIGGTSKASGRSGAYVLADQTVWRDEADSARSLHVFGQATEADAATSPFRHWYSVGVVLHKPFANRPADTVGVAFGRAVVNPRTRAVQENAAASLAAADQIDNLDTGEQLLELSYGAQITPWLLLRPDLQYIKEPGAFYGVKRDNALLAGLQIKSTF